MQKIYIDFDGTLFNADSFYQDFLKVCLEFKITKEMVDTAKEKLFVKSCNFNMDNLLNYFIKNYNVKDEIKNKVSKLYNPKYVFSDVVLNLEKLKEKYELIILTLGVHDYQLQKINGSGLRDYFSKIITTEDNKAGLDEVDYKNSIFIDNNPKEVKKFIEVGAKKVIRIRRSQDKYSIHDLELPALEYSNFDDIFKNELIDNNIA